MSRVNMELYKNASGCEDPTAGEAIENVEKKSGNEGEKERKERFYKLLGTIFNVCELSGFHLEGRITVKDMKTGKIWR